MLMAVLGGNDAGGGVIWAPKVLNDAKQHGLILSEKGKIYDTKIGQNLPHNEKEMPALTKKELSQFPEIEASEITPFYVARYLDLYSLSKRNFVSVIGEHGVIYDKPGFEVNFISEKCTNKIKNFSDRDTVLMPVEGCWNIESDIFNLTLNPGDTFSVPKNTQFNLKTTKPYMSSMYQVIPTDDPAGATQIRTA